MNRPVVISFLWPKNYPVLLQLAARAGVDIAAPVALVPGAFALELEKSGARHIPLIASDFARYQSESESPAAERASKIREALPALLSTPRAATAQTTAASVAVVDDLIAASIRDGMAIIEELDALAAAEDILAVLVNETDLAAGRMAAAWARSRGFPSMLFSHGGNIGTAYTVTRCMLADYLFVFSQRGTETYRDIGIPLERMVITGNPAWDCYPQVLADRAQYRESLYSRMGLRAGEPVVMFATIWNTKLTACLETDAFEKTLRGFLQGCKRLRERGVPFNVVIKDRPSNAEFGKNETDRIGQEEGFTDFAFGVGDMEAYMAAVDLVVSHDSNVFVEAMIAGVPAVNLWTPSSWLIGPGFDVADGIPMIQYTNDKALADIMGAILSERATRESVISQMARSLPRFHVATDGNSTARCVEAVLQLMKKPSAKSNPAANGVAEHASTSATARLLRRTPLRVLDVGSGPRDLAASIKAKHPGVEIIHMNVERMQAVQEDWGAIAPGSIDTLILIRALEELHDPGALLLKLRPYLTRDAQVLAAVPNVRNLWLLSALVSGSWDQSPGDLLDERRIRFYTLKSVAELFVSAGYTLDRIDQRVDPRVPEIDVPASGTLTLESDILTLKGLTPQDVYELRTLEFTLSAKPN